MSALAINFIAGYCPVQSEGWVAGRPYYFRARGEKWTFGVGDDPVMAPEFKRSGDWGDGPFAAGWMEHDEARQIIERCANEYMIEHPERGQSLVRKLFVTAPEGPREPNTQHG